MAAPPRLLLPALLLSLVLASAAAAAFVPADALDPAGDWSHAALRDVHAPSLFEALAPAEASDYRKVGASDRPEGHPQALILGALALLLLCAVLLWRRRPQLAAWRHDMGSRGRWSASWRALRPMAPILALATVARVATLGLRPMMEDEWTNVEAIPLRDVLFHGYEVLTNPPGLAAVEHFFYAVSLNPWWYRLPVAFSGVLLVFAIWRLVRELCGERAALLAATLCAVHPGLIVWSQTVRGYVPAAALVLLATSAAVRTLRNGRDRDAVALAIWSSLACWTHYTAVFALMGAGPWLLWRARRDRAGQTRMLLAGAASALAFVPLLPWVLSDVGHKQGNGWMPDFVANAVAFMTGVPLGLGWLMLLVIVIGRPWRRAGGRALLALTGLMTLAQLATAPVVFQTPPYLAAASACLLGLVAVASERLIARATRRQRRLWLLAMIAPLVLTTIALDALPLTSPLGADVAQPFVLRARGHARFARTVRDMRIGAVPGPQCANVATMRAPEREVWLYHLGGLTQQDLGAEPFSEHHGTVFRIALTAPEGKRALDLHQLDNHDAPRETSLQTTLTSHGCFFLVASFQHCGRRRGLMYNAAACGWLEANCRQLDGIAHEELWYCERPERAP